MTPHAEPTPHRSARDILDVLFRRAPLILALFGAIVLLCVLGTLTRPAQYESVARVLIKLGRENIGVDASIVSPNTVVTPSAERRHEILSEIEILRSRTLTERVVEQLGAEKFDGEQTWFRSARHALDDLLSNHSVSPQDRVVLMLEKNLKVEQIAESNVVAVAYRAHSQSLAREVVDTLLTHYRDLHIDIHNRLARVPTRPGEATPRSLSTVYMRLVDKYRRQLKAAEAELQQFKRDHNISALNEQIRLAIEQIHSLTAQFDRFSSDIAKATFQIEETRKKLSEIPPQIPLEIRSTRNATLQRLENELISFQLERARLRTLYMPDSRQLLDLDRQIETVKTRIESEQLKAFSSETVGVNATYMALERALLFGEAERAGLTHQVETLTAQIATRQTALQALTDNEKALAVRTRAVAEQKRWLERTNDKLNQSAIEETQDAEKITNIALVQPASTPLKPMSPSPTLFIFLSIIAAALVSVGMAFVVEAFDHSLNNEWTASDRLALPVLGSVPNGLSDRLPAPGQGSPNESITMICERLKKRQDQPPIRIIQVTSAVHGEGTSTVALQMAATLARDPGVRVLLVDTNFRRPILHYRFRDVAGDRPSSLDETIPNLPGVQVKSTSEPNLFVVLNTRDQAAFEPRALFASDTFEQFVTQATNLFDYIVFDSAPVNPYSDTPALADALRRHSKAVSDMADATVLVVQAGKTRWEVARHAVENLRQAGVAPEGLVLNRRVYPIPEFVYSRL